MESAETSVLDALWFNFFLCPILHPSFLLQDCGANKYQVYCKARNSTQTTVLKNHCYFNEMISERQIKVNNILKTYKSTKCQVDNTENPIIKKVLVIITREFFAIETWQSTLNENPREFRKKAFQVT